MSILSGAGSLASLYAVYENWRGQPQAKQMQEDISFIKWLCDNGFSDIAKDLELIISQNQRLEDITNDGVSLLHKELRLINEKLRSEEKTVKFDVALKLYEQAPNIPVELADFSYLIWIFRPTLINKSKRMIRDFSFQIYSTLEQTKVYIGKGAMESVEDLPFRASPDAILFYNDELDEGYKIHVKLTKNNIEEQKKKKINLIVKWDGGQRKQTFLMKKFFCINGRELTKNDFPIYKPEKDYSSPGIVII